MNNLKKFLLMSVAGVTVLTLFAACNKNEEITDSAEPSVVEEADVDEMNVDVEESEDMIDLEDEEGEEASDSEADESTSETTEEVK